MNKLKAMLGLCGILVACGGNTSLGTEDDGLTAGQVCPTDRCACTSSPCAEEQIGIKRCADGSNGPVACLSNGAGSCRRESYCPNDCTEAACGPRPGAPALACLDGSSSDFSCGSAAGECGWQQKACPETIPADATTLAAISPGGGFVPKPPDGSACKMSQQSYILNLSTSIMSWEQCEIPPNDAPYVLRKGDRTLTTEQVQGIRSAILGLKVPQQPTKCATDGAPQRIEITSTQKGVATYYDASECGNPAPLADNVSQVFVAMSALVPAK